MANESCYYPAFARGVVSYSKVLEHFKEQASNRGKSKVINSEGRSGRKGKLVVLSTTTGPCGSENNKGGNQDPPPVQVIDPTEADRRRALDKIQKEIVRGRSATYSVGNTPQKKAGVKRKRDNSGGGGKKKQKSQQQASKAVRKVIKRVRDIFD
jgi:hypothetical protein